MEFINTPAPQRHPQVLHTKRKKTFPRKLLIVAIMAVLLIVMAWQQIRVINLQSEVAELKKTQLPQNNFKDYSDCFTGGGISAYFNNSVLACLGKGVNSKEDVGTYQVFLNYTVKDFPHLIERQTSNIENNVKNNIKASKSLVDFLKFDYWGCQVKGEYEIIKEVTERFALLKYGCVINGEVQLGNTPYIIAIKLSDGWMLISNSNNRIDTKGVPNCLLVDIFKISKDLTPKCRQNTGFSDGAIVDVDYP